MLRSPRWRLPQPDKASKLRVDRGGQYRFPYQDVLCRKPKSVSLHPLRFHEALKAIVGVDPDSVGITSKHLQDLSAESPNPRSPESQVTQAQSSQNSAQTKEPSPSQVPSAELSSPESSAEKVKAEEQTGESGGTAKPPTQDTCWAEWVMAGATVVYSFFAILQWRALKNTVDETQGLVVTANRQAAAAEAPVNNLEKTIIATEKAADASKQNAELAEESINIAKLALQNERPVLSAEMQEVNKARTADYFASVKFRNRGRGSAIIQEVRLELRLAMPNESREPKIDYPKA